jgi:hypothetical protein
MDMSKESVNASHISSKVMGFSEVNGLFGRRSSSPSSCANAETMTPTATAQRVNRNIRVVVMNYSSPLITSQDGIQNLCVPYLDLRIAKSLNATLLDKHFAIACLLVHNELEKNCMGLKPRPYIVLTDACGFHAHSLNELERVPVSHAIPRRQSRDKIMGITSTVRVVSVCVMSIVLRVDTPITVP